MHHELDEEILFGFCGILREIMVFTTDFRKQSCPQKWTELCGFEFLSLRLNTNEISLVIMRAEQSTKWSFQFTWLPSFYWRKLESIDAYAEGWCTEADFWISSLLFLESQCQDATRVNTENVTIITLIMFNYKGNSGFNSQNTLHKKWLLAAMDFQKVIIIDS